MSADVNGDVGDLGPLFGVTVLDLSRVLSGPYAAQLLGDMGARVIKVERPGAGDDTRSWGPPFVGEGADVESTYFLSANRNKESITLDFNSDADMDHLWKLIERADVVIENFRLGVLDRVGLSHEDILARNPGAVVLSISGFGSVGPDRNRPGYDQIIQGESGLMSITGPDSDSPTKMGIPISDLLTGIFGALGVVTALYERQATGLGQVVSTSLLASSIAVHAFQGTRWLVAGELPAAMGNRHPTVSPYGTYRALDGIIQIAVGNDSLWRKFAPIVGLSPDDVRFDSNSKRSDSAEELTALIEAAFMQRSVDDLVEAIDALGVPVGEVKSFDRVYEDPQVVAEGMILSVAHKTLGSISLPGFPIRFKHSRLQHSAPPTLGQHTDEIVQWLDSTSDGELT